MKKPAKSSELYHGIRFQVMRVEGYDNDGRPFTKELVQHPGAVVILPFLNDLEILLIRNERITVNQTLWELPAGTLEPNEAPDQTALRELREETGYGAEWVKPLTSFFTTPGFCNEKLYAYSAHNLKWVGQALDEGEKITVHRIPLLAAIEMIQKGEICDGKTIASLLYYHTFHTPT